MPKVFHRDDHPGWIFWIWSEKGQIQNPDPLRGNAHLLLGCSPGASLMIQSVFLDWIIKDWLRALWAFRGSIIYYKLILGKSVLSYIDGSKKQSNGHNDKNHGFSPLRPISGRKSHYQP